MKLSSISIASSLQDTIVENDHTVIMSGQDQAQSQGDANVLVSGASSSNNHLSQRLEANDAVDKLRAQQFAGLSLDKKIEAILSKAASSEKAAYSALTRVEAFGKRLDTVLKRLEAGQGVVGNAQPQGAKFEPGTSVLHDF
jgi:hypothetical protein